LALSGTWRFPAFGQFLSDLGRLIDLAFRRLAFVFIYLFIYLVFFPSACMYFHVSIPLFLVVYGLPACVVGCWPFSAPDLLLRLAASTLGRPGTRYYSGAQPLWRSAIVGARSSLALGALYRSAALALRIARRRSAPGFFGDLWGRAAPELGNLRSIIFLFIFVFIFACHDH